MRVTIVGTVLAVLLVASLTGSRARADEHAESAHTIVVDWPTDGTVVPPRVTVVGWAIAESSSQGTGIDAVRAYVDGPAGSGVPLGQATYGLTRPDVAVARGHGRFAPSGWRMEADLPPGPRVMYLYAHLADQPADEGWIGPVQIAVHVGGTGPGPVAPARDPGAATSSASCGEADSAAGRCGPAPGSTSSTPGCLTVDAQSGRCAVRVPSAGRAVAPGAGAVPGSWTAGSPTAPDGGSSGAGASPTASGGSASTTNSGAPGPAPAPGAARGGSEAAGVPGRAGPPALSLTGASIVGRQVQLSWNQMNASGPVMYEIRRCASVSSATSTCDLVATVQAAGYRLLHADGVYVVRAVGPQGQFHGESNRLHVCCGSMPTLWQ